MNPCLLFAALALTPGQDLISPLAKSKQFADSMQWAAIEACPKLTVRSTDSATGSAVALAVKDGFVWLLTAGHVVRPGAATDVDFCRRASYPARDLTLNEALVVAKDPISDLALMKVPLREEDRVPPCLKLVLPGQRSKAFPFPALAVGCDEGGSARCTADEVIARTLVRRGKGEMAFFWETATESKPGRSGGALLDKQGRVIGICSARQNEHGFYTHSDEIHAWLKPLGYDWLWKDSVLK